MQSKDEIRKEFSKKWQNYYKIQFLIEKGYKRKICKKCGKGFWTILEKDICCDCEPYSFIGNPPTKKRIDYIEMWKALEKFFSDNGHFILKRYPVVCRWYPLYFTIAGIIDFYRIENGNLVFDFPANPVYVNQTCLRFNDIPNVGITGRHYSCFVMVQQSSVYDGKNGYWKERCIELDFEFLTKILGIKPEEIDFLEDVWIGPKAFGSCMEYFSRGLELGNAVFTEFIYNGSVKEMKEKIIDMGAGLERFSWITFGTPTSYDITFGPIVEKLKKQIDISYDKKLFLKYAELSGIIDMAEKEKRAKIARKLGISVEEMKKMIEPIEAMYAILDHTKALTYAISDGMLPSNVGGGYNLRVILRRALSFIDKFKWDLDLAKICEMHAKFLKPIEPELIEHIDEINKILEIETKRFYSTKERAERIMKKLSEKGEMDEQTLIKLYESDGITPELVKEFLDIEIPDDFYAKVTEKHISEEEREEKTLEIKDVPDTRLIFYEDPEKMEFEAKVLKIIEKNIVILDQTCFYPESGGQASDKGFINGCKVIHVSKIGNVVLHEMESINFKEGDLVKCKVDKETREILRKHHTATHIINAASRKILGPHVWQAGSEKTTEKARLDITHFDALSEEEIEKIENVANEIVKKKIPVKIEWLPRGEAERKYTFRIYQGGAVPGKQLRIVSIPNVDVEACGGIHCKNTGDVGFITILNTERIQDGVVRLEYTCGQNAIKILKEKEKIVNELKDILKVSEEKIPETVERLFEDWKRLGKDFDKLKEDVGRKLAEKLGKEFVNKKGISILFKAIENLKSDELRELGAKLSKEDTLIFLFGISDKIYVYCKGSSESVKRGINIGNLCKEICSILGGKGGGSDIIGEGFGLDKSRIKDVEKFLDENYDIRK